MDINIYNCTSASWLHVLNMTGVLNMEVHMWTYKFTYPFQKVVKKAFNHRYSHVLKALTHWGRVTHICVSNLTIIGSDNGLSPGRRQAIIWTNAGVLLIGPRGTNFSGILIGIQTFSFKKMHLKMSSGKRRPFCLVLNVLIIILISWFSSIKASKCP